MYEVFLVSVNVVPCAASKIAAAVAPVAVVSRALGVIVTVGVEVYPEPMFVIVMVVIAPLKIVATAVAPVPPPPSILIVGILLYPVPPLVSVIDDTYL